MGKTTGGPILTFGDLMEDLSHDEIAPDHLSQDTSSPGLQQSIPTVQNLESTFEKTYKELELALAGSGHSWTSLTQQLYSSLTCANEVVTIADSNFKLLNEKISGLQAVLQRGDAVTNQLREIISKSESTTT